MGVTKMLKEKVRRSTVLLGVIMATSAGLAHGQALPTFETGTGGWSTTSSNSVGSNFSTGVYGISQVTTYDNITSSTDVAVGVDSVAAPPSAGSPGQQFGLFSLGSSAWIADPNNSAGNIPEGCQVANIGGNPCAATFSFSISGATTATDQLWLRLYSADTSGSGYDDSISYRFLGSSNDLLANGVLSVEGFGAGGNIPINTGNLTGNRFDSNWQLYTVPVGATFLELTLSNSVVPGTTDGDLYNLPVMAVDYVAAVPVPEPSSYAMLAAGLAVLGSLRKRRR